MIDRRYIANTLGDLLYDAGLRAPVSEDRIDRAVCYVEDKLDDCTAEWLAEFVEKETNEEAENG